MIQHPVQPMIAYGFVDFEGNTWLNAWVDSYNNYTFYINKTLVTKTDSLAEKERNFFLDQRHKFFVGRLEACRAELKKFNESFSNETIADKLILKLITNNPEFQFD